MRLSALVEAANGGLVPVPVTRERPGAPATVVPDPEVTTVITTDLLDPRRYLSGGELVLSGLAWWRPRAPRRSKAFVAALVEGGAAALAAGEAEHGSVPRDLVAACAAAGLPLLRVPVEVSFASITELAARQLSGRDDLAALLARHRALVAAVAGREATGLGGVLDLVGADLGLGCWVLSPAGRPIAGPALPAAEARLLARAFLRAPALPHVVRRPNGRLLSLFADAGAGGPAGPRAARWALVVESDHTGWRDGRRAVVDELASLVGVELDLSRRRSDVERQLATALDRGAPEEAVTAAVRCGLEPGRPAVVVTGAGPLVLPILVETFAGRPRSALGPPEAGSDPAIAVVQDQASAEVIAALESTVDVLAPGLGPEAVRIGVSDAVTGGAGLVAALAEARAVAGATASRRHTVAGPELLSSHALLLAAVPPELAAAFRARVLGPLIEHDRAHRGALVATLREYLDCSGSWARCAERMHLHVNTLRYRVERIEALTGKDLRRLEDQADLLLALRIPAP